VSPAWRTLAAATLMAAAPTGTLAQSGTEFQPELYFAGVTRSAGVLTDASGRPTGGFTGVTRGGQDRDGATVFDQTIRFSDGTVRSRSWRLARTGPGRIAATGSEVVGVATGEISGRTLRLLSTIRLDPGNPFSDVDFDQVFELQPDGRRVTNRSVISKLGVVVSGADETFVRAGRRAGRAGR